MWTSFLLGQENSAVWRIKMLKRNLTAIVLISIALFFLLYLRTLHTAFADVLFLAFAFLGAGEMILVGKKCGYNALLIPLIFYAVAVYPCFWFFGATGVLAAFCLSSVSALGDFILERKKYELKDLEYTFLILVYPALLCSLFMLVNRSYGNLLAIFYILFVTLLSDAFALFAGMLFGKKKLIEDVSPKKTVAGAYGAFVGGLIGATVVLLLFDVFRLFDRFPNVGLTHLFDKKYVSALVYLFFAPVCTCLAILGDLAASWLKRKMGVKDFGKIFPGHGGVMDRLDSLLFVVPAVFLFFVVYNGVAL